MNKITQEQYEKLNSATNKKDFHKMLEEYTGITAKPCLFNVYYDTMGNYVGNSQYDSLDKILSNAKTIIDFVRRNGF